MKQTRNKIADITEKKNAFPYTNGKYLGNGMHLKTQSQMEGLSYTREETFEQAVLKGKDLPILCDTCEHSNKTEFTCPYFKFTKAKFRELQEEDYCLKVKKLISHIPSV